MVGSLKRFYRGIPWILTLGVVGSLGAGPPGGVSPVKSIEILAEKDAVRAGELLRLAVKVTLADEFHVNSHVPSAEYLIPTTFELVAPEGLVAGEWQFPKGKDRRFPFSDVPLNVYEGTFVIQGSLTAAPNSAPGKKEARGVLKYQACTSQRCFPPKKEEVILLVRIVPPGTPVQPLHPEMFQPILP